MMTFLTNFLVAELPESLLFFVQHTGVEVKTIHKELTPIGWIVVIVLPLALIFGIIFLIAKFLKKSKLK